MEINISELYGGDGGEGVAGDGRRWRVVTWEGERIGVARQRGVEKRRGESIAVEGRGRGGGGRERMGEEGRGR